MTELTGENLVAGDWIPSPEALNFERTWDSKRIGPPYSQATLEQISLAVDGARDVFEEYRAIPLNARAALLRAMAVGIEGLGDTLIDHASMETWLPAARLEGERARTTNQLRMFADLIESGAHLEVRIDHALPDRTPIPRPDLRRTMIPIGPVAVFGASNFPLAFSVAGGDTASALAAGCPVIVKAHPGHPGTSELVARAVQSAIEASAFPKGLFSMLHTGDDGAAFLVRHPELAGVGFTGSKRVGRMLFDIGAQRERPIPVFAEMGSINPIFVMPGAMDDSSEQIAKGYVQSLTLGFGQFCTNPGILVLPASAKTEALLDRIAADIGALSPAPMLTGQVFEGYSAGVSKLAELAEPLSVVQDGPAMFRASAENFLGNSDLSAEVFGPCGVAIVCESSDDMLRVAQGLEGQLTATIWSSEQDDVTGLVRALETKVGRLVFDGFPTGVEVCPAMQHGGPYPATTDSRFTSVGTAAIERWLRPICYQNMPERLRPDFFS